MLRLVIAIPLIALALPALAQQQSGSDLENILRVQRNYAMDQAAMLAVRVGELQKKLDAIDAKAAEPKPPEKPSDHP